MGSTKYRTRIRTGRRKPPALGPQPCERHAKTRGLQTLGLGHNPTSNDHPIDRFWFEMTVWARTGWSGVDHFGLKSPNQVRASKQGTSIPNPPRARPVFARQGGLFPNGRGAAPATP